MATKIAVTNQKGGVGKTTTSINLADALKRMGYKTLLVDFDISHNASDTYGVNSKDDIYTLYDVLDNECTTKDAIISTPMGDIIPGDNLFGENESHFSEKMGRENLLKRKLKEVDNDYDFIVIDTPPTLGLYMLNALVAANGCVIPIKAEHYSLSGLENLQKTIEKVKESSFNDYLTVYGAFLNVYDSRKKIDRELCLDFAEEIAKVGFDGFDTKIKVCQDIVNVQSIKNKENGEIANRSIYSNYPDSTAAHDFIDFTNELISRIVKSA